MSAWEFSAGGQSLALVRGRVVLALVWQDEDGRWWWFGQDPSPVPAEGLVEALDEAQRHVDGLAA